MVLCQWFIYIYLQLIQLHLQMAFKGKMMFIMAVSLVLPLSLLGMTLQSQDKIKRDSASVEEVLALCNKRSAEDLLTEEGSSVCGPTQVCELDSSWIF